MSTIAGAGVGVATAINPVAGAITGVVAGLTSGLGPKYTKANAVQRFVAAQAASDYNTARTLVDQSYYHAYLQDGIPDKADWVNIYQQMVQLSGPTMRDYENTKSGAGRTATGTTGQGAVVATPPAVTAGMSTGGLSLVWLGVLFLAAGAAAWFFLKKRR